MAITSNGKTLSVEQLRAMGWGEALKTQSPFTRREVAYERIKNKRAALASLRVVDISQGVMRLSDLQNELQAMRA